MNNNWIKKKWIIIGVSSVLVAVWIFIAISSSKQTDKNNPEKTNTEYQDPDTGDTVSNQPDVTPENNDGQSNEYLVLGLSSMVEYGSVSLSEQQAPVFRKDLISNGVKFLPDAEKTLKIINPRINRETGFMESDLKYKEGSSNALVIYDIKDRVNFSYVIILDNKTVYQSGKLNNSDTYEEPEEEL